MKMSEMKCPFCNGVGRFAGPYFQRQKGKMVTVCGTCHHIVNWEAVNNGSESKPKKQGTGRQKKNRA